MSVVNVRKAELRRSGYADFEEWAADSSHVYVGRNMTFYVPGTVGSKWRNPFSVKKYGRDECLRRYEEYIRSTPALYDALSELDGKILGCWCHPERCHADVLLHLRAEQRFALRVERGRK